MYSNRAIRGSRGDAVTAITTTFTIAIAIARRGLAYLRVFATRAAVACFQRASALSGRGVLSPVRTPQNRGGGEANRTFCLIVARLGLEPRVPWVGMC